MNRTYIIAEIGTSHGGDLEKAYQLIDAAVFAGADCVKFQWVYADEILHPDTGMVELPTGSVRLYDRFLSLEVPVSFFEKVCDYARSKGVAFACTPFGIRSLRQLWELRPDAIKIASPELNHFPMLEKLLRLESECDEKSRIPVILSSGVSKLKDIDKTLKLLKPLQCDDFAEAPLPAISLLHCVTSYPAPETDYNLAVLNFLREHFSIDVGVSDHSLDPVLVPTITAAAGGKIIEKHITLSRETDGLDDPVALTPEDFALMVQKVHKIDLLEPQERLVYLTKEFGCEKVNAILGDGQKKLAASEKANYERTNRSIHYLKALKAGTTIQEKDIAVLRTEKVLTPGISPEFFKQIPGRRLKVDVSAGAGLLWEDLTEV